MSTKRTTAHAADDGSETWHAIRRPSPSAMGGALFGGVMGAAFGPAGAIVGMVVGGVAGEIVERRHGAVSSRSPIRKAT